MVFSNLSLELQNILLNNHSYITKWLVFLCIIFFSFYYVFVVWKDHKPTKFFSVMAMRMFFFGVSISYIASIPFLILLMSPDYSFGNFYVIPLLLYSVFMGVIFLLLFIDGVRYGPFVLLKLAGMNLGDDNANEIARWFTNNKHFLKIKKIDGGIIKKLR